MGEKPTDHDAIDAEITRRIDDLDVRAELLGAGKTVVYVDDEGRIVEETPDGVITVLRGTGEWS